MAEKPPAKVVETFRQKPSKLGSTPQPAETVTLQPGPQGSGSAADAMAAATRLSNRSKWRLLAGSMLAFNATIGVFAYYRFIKNKPGVPAETQSVNGISTNASSSSSSHDRDTPPPSGGVALAGALPGSGSLAPSVSSASVAPTSTHRVGATGTSLISCMDVKQRFTHLQAQLAQWRAVKPASPVEKERLNAEKAELKQQLDSVAVLLADACDQM